MFYTYLYLREDGTPYYVGKGKGRRVFKKEKNHYPPKDQNRIKLQYWEDENTAIAYEKYFIDFWGRIDIGTGILRNLTDGGEGTSGVKFRGRRPISEETRRLMSGSAKRRPPTRLGSTWSEELKKKMSGINSGKPNPKNSEHLKKNPRPRNPVTGRLLSDTEIVTGKWNTVPTKATEETRLKMSKSHEGFRHTEESIAKMRGKRGPRRK
jgi:hypothetical protein